MFLETILVTTLANDGRRSFDSLRSLFTPAHSKPTNTPAIRRLSQRQKRRGRNAKSVLSSFDPRDRKSE